MLGIICYFNQASAYVLFWESFAVAMLNHGDLRFVGIEKCGNDMFIVQNMDHT